MAADDLNRAGLRGPFAAKEWPTPKLVSGLEVGDVDWLAEVLIPVSGTSPVHAARGQRIIDLLRHHETDFRLDAEAREQRLKDQWASWDREAAMRHCIICSEIGWTQDMSGREHVLCMCCGRPLCLTHYVVHKHMADANWPVGARPMFLTPDEYRKKLADRFQAHYGREMPQHLDLRERGEMSTTIKLGVNGVRSDYTLFPDEYEQHWKHRCRTPIPVKDMKVLRAEQAALYAALIEIDKQMEQAPAEPDTEEKKP